MEAENAGYCNEEDRMERRAFLGGLSVGPLGVLSDGSFGAFARKYETVRAGATFTGGGSFETAPISVSGNTIFVRRYGKGPAILLVHGFPRTSLMWRLLAPKLAEDLITR